jgi:hypothetical protein
MEIEGFKKHLLQKGKSESTASSYVKNVARCIKKDNVEEYIENIKSSSHRSFVKSSWSAWIEYTRTERGQDSNLISLFKVMKDLDADKVLCANLADRKEIGNTIIYSTNKGILTLSLSQETIIRMYSCHGKLLDIT